MGIFNHKSNCPICEREINFLTMSTIKYRRENICQDCVKKITNNGGLSQFKKIDEKDIEYLRRLVADERENTVVDKEGNNTKSSVPKSEKKPIQIKGYRGICPICECEITPEELNNSFTKYKDSYICKSCKKNIASKSRDAIQYLSLKDLEYLRELVSTPEKTKAEQMKEYTDKIQRDKKIVKTTILNTINDSRKKAGSTLVRGAIGGELFGIAGVAAGAMSAKNKIESKTTFLIEYQSGRKETKTVNNESKEYQELVKYL